MKKLKHIIGQAIIYISLYVGAVVFSMWAFCQNTIY